MTGKAKRLRWTGRLWEWRCFVAGADIEDKLGNIVTLYRMQMGLNRKPGARHPVSDHGRLHGQSPRRKSPLPRGGSRLFHVLAFELGSMFAANGEIFDEQTFLRRGIPESRAEATLRSIDLGGIDRLPCESASSDFRIYTATISASHDEYGSDYLLA